MANSRFDFPVINTLVGNVADPQLNQDAATKAYVDARAGGAIYWDTPNPTPFGTIAVVATSGSNSITFGGNVTSSLPANQLFVLSGDTTLYTATSATFNGTNTVVAITPNLANSVTLTTTGSTATRMSFTDMRSGGGITGIVTGNVLTLSSAGLPTLVEPVWRTVNRNTVTNTLTVTDNNQDPTYVFRSSGTYSGAATIAIGSTAEPVAGADALLQLTQNQGTLVGVINPGPIAISVPNGTSLSAALASAQFLSSFFTSPLLWTASFTAPASVTFTYSGPRDPILSGTPSLNLTFGGTWLNGPVSNSGLVASTTNFAPPTFGTLNSNQVVQAVSGTPTANQVVAWDANNGRLNWQTPTTQGITSVNAQTGPAITLVAGANVTLSTANNTISIASSGGGGGSAGQVIAFNTGPVTYSNITYSVGGTGTNPTEQSNEGTIYIGTGTAYSTNNAVVMPGSTTKGYQFFGTQVGSAASDFVAGTQVFTIGVSGTSSAARTALQIINSGLPFFRRINSWYDNNPITGTAYTVSGTTMTIVYNIDASSIVSTDLAPWVGCALLITGTSAVYNGYYQVATVSLAGRVATITFTVQSGGPASGTCTLQVFSSQFPGYIGFQTTPTRSDLTPQAPVVATGEYQVLGNRNLSFTFGTPFQFSGNWYININTNSAIINSGTAGTFDFSNPINFGGFSFGSLVVDAIQSSTSFNLRIPAGFSSAPTVTVPSGTTTSVWNNGDVPSLTSFGTASTSTPNGFIRVTIQPNSWTANSLSGAFNTAQGFFLPDTSGAAGTFLVCWDIFCSVGINVNSLNYTNSAANWNNRHAFNGIAGGNLNTPPLQQVLNAGSTATNAIAGNVAQIQLTEAVSGGVTFLDGTKVTSRVHEISGTTTGSVSLKTVPSVAPYTLTFPSALNTATSSFVQVDNTGLVSFRSVQSEVENIIAQDLTLVKTDGLSGTFPVAIANTTIIGSNVTGLVWSGGTSFATGQVQIPLQIVPNGQTATGSIVLSVGTRTLIVDFSGTQLATNSFQGTSLTVNDPTATFPPATTTAQTIYMAVNVGAGSFILPNTGSTPKGLSTYIRDSASITWSATSEPNTFVANATASGVNTDVLTFTSTTFTVTTNAAIGATTIAVSNLIAVGTYIQFSNTAGDFIYQVTASTATSLTIASPGLVAAVNSGTLIYSISFATTATTDLVSGNNITLRNIGGRTQIVGTAAAVNFGGQPISSISIAAPLAGTYSAGNLQISNSSLLNFLPSARLATTANITLSGLQTIDGVVTVAGDVILVKNQTTTNQNGLYNASSTAWTRVASVPATSYTNGVVAVSQGASQATNIYLQTATIGTFADAQNWILFSANGAASLGATLAVGKTATNAQATGLLLGSDLTSGAIRFFNVAASGLALQFYNATTPANSPQIYATAAGALQLNSPTVTQFFTSSNADALSVSQTTVARTGTGNLSILAGTNNGDAVILGTNNATTVNNIAIFSATAGFGATLTAQGADTNIPLVLTAKGTSGITLGSNLINYWMASGAATTNPVALNAVGSDTNIGININSKGTGSFTLSGVNNGLQIVTGTTAGVTLSPNTSQQTLTNSQLRLAGLGNNVNTSAIVIGTNFPTSLVVSGSGPVASPAQNAKVTLQPQTGGASTTIDVNVLGIGSGNVVLANPTQCAVQVLGNQLTQSVLQAVSTTVINCSLLISPQGTGNITIGDVTGTNAQLLIQTSSTTQLIEGISGGATNVDRVISAKGTGTTILLNGAAFNSGSTASPAYNAPLFAADKPGIPTAITAGSIGSQLLSRGSGASPYWWKPGNYESTYTTTTTITAGTNFIVIFPTAGTNLSALSYNTSTGLFTANRACYVLFSFDAIYSSISISTVTEGDIWLSKNGTVSTGTRYGQVAFNLGASATQNSQILNLNQPMILNAGDTVYCYSWCSGNWVLGASAFGGVQTRLVVVELAQF